MGLYFAVESLTGPNNYTLLSHLRLCSIFVASYDLQGLRWRYSNPPPQGVPQPGGLGPRIYTTRKGLGPRIYTPRNRVAQLYPRALGLMKCHLVTESRNLQLCPYSYV
jgi:hypothetical protein